MADYCNDVIDEFLEDIGNLTDNFDDLSTGSDNELRAENRRAKKRRLKPRSDYSLFERFTYYVFSPVYSFWDMSVAKKNSLNKFKSPPKKSPIKKIKKSSRNWSEEERFVLRTFINKYNKEERATTVYQILQLELGISV
ncbi:hypothetical protein OUZ56_009008 [Daphnia magna]|uniref:Uncharacterized protein n=1 Tax=Daphnia magna TaxID=35525 RepID=A0ABR0AF43_9CRUS|nr:hypothetical protein OUZ56_009008 [Daphnia magna]